MKTKLTADNLFALSGRSYESAVRRLQHACKEGGWNPLGGEADDVDVSVGFSDDTVERPSIPGVRVFERRGAVIAVTRPGHYPLARIVLYPG
jgi:hypothetical protein